MKIEKASPEDYLVLTEITFDGKSFWEYSKENLEQWKKELTITEDYIQNNNAYILILNDEIIGYYSYIKRSKSEIELDNLFLYKRFIGKGFGKLLMEDFLKKAQNKNIKTVFLISDPNAENFYKKFGFKTFDLKKSSILGRFLPKMKLSFQ